MVFETPIVEINDLSVSFPTDKGELRAVDHLSLSINQGELLGVVGESGCGKSTLAFSLLKAVPPPGKVIGGKIVIDSVDLDTLKGESLRRFRWRNVSMVFQSAMNALDPVKTIETQMLETILQHEPITRQEAEKRITRLLALVRIDSERKKAFPHELSGGMRQRVVIAMALCLEPKLLIADEPTTALDVVVQAGVLRTIKELQKELGITIILISHDASIMWEVADRLAVMYAAKLVEVGKTSDVVVNPRHPYTEALLKAVPVLGIDQQVIKGIPGSPPSLIAPPQGCRFNPRCPYAFDRCRTDEPHLNRNNGYAACWLRE
jgi:peptide/nickel transport system ATP-binding protein